jgi:inositol 1,4,5-triphosphate receptor type 2
MLTMMLALILIYLFSLLGFLFFRDDFSTNIQTQKYSMRYRRSNHLIKTMSLTRMSTNCCQSLSFIVLLIK